MTRPFAASKLQPPLPPPLPPVPLELLPAPLLPGLPPKAMRPQLSRGWKAGLAAFLLAPIVVAAGLFYPMDSYALSPGPASDVGDLVRIEGTRRPSKGAFLLTTVSVTIDTINPFEAIRAWFDPAIETIPREALVGNGLTDEQQNQINQADMEESKYNAMVVAATIAGLPVQPIPGARVIKVLAGMPAAAVLKEGDVITAVGGVAVRSAGEMSAAIRRHPAGTRLTFSVLRGEQTAEVAITSTTEPSDPQKRPLIGIITGPAYKIPINISVDSQNIVGPSAGLMFALAIADALTDEDLTRGHRIAGTGTIDLEGKVGRIGGVGQKIRAAEFAGASIFLSPPEDFAEAKATARSIRVFSVATIQDAVKVLERLKPTN